jgi:hypothetical protein
VDTANCPVSALRRTQPCQPSNNTPTVTSTGTGSRTSPPVRNPIASAFVRNVRLDRRRFPSPTFGNDNITTQRFDDLS